MNRFISITQDDKLTELIAEDGGKMLLPSSQVIIIDETPKGAAKTVRLVNSRKVLGILV